MKKEINNSMELSRNVDKHTESETKKKYTSLQSLKRIGDYTDSHLINLYVFCTDQFVEKIEKSYTSKTSEGKRSVITTVRGNFISGGISKTIFDKLDIGFNYDYYKSVFSGDTALTKQQKENFYYSIINYLLTKKEVPEHIKEQYIWLYSNYTIKEICEILECDYQSIFSNDEYHDYRSSSLHLSYKRFFNIVKNIGIDKLDKKVFSKELNAYPYMHFITALFDSYKSYAYYARHKIGRSEARSIHENCKKINIRFFYEGALKLRLSDEEIQAKGQELNSNFNLERVKIGYVVMNKSDGLYNFLLNNKGIVPARTRKYTTRDIIDSIFNGTDNIHIIRRFKEIYFKEEIMQLQKVIRDKATPEQHKAESVLKLKDLLDIEDFKKIFYSKQSKYNDFRNVNLSLIASYQGHVVKGYVKLDQTTNLWINNGVPLEDGVDFFYKKVVCDIIQRDQYIEMLTDCLVNIPFSD